MSKGMDQIGISDILLVHTSTSSSLSYNRLVSDSAWNFHVFLF